MNNKSDYLALAAMLSGLIAGIIGAYAYALIILVGVFVVYVFNIGAGTTKGLRK